MRKIFARHALTPQGWLSQAEIRIDSQGHIESLGPAPQGTRFDFALALPGMSNLHSHAFQRAMAGLGETRAKADDDFWSWRQRMYQLAKRLTPHLMEVVAAHLYGEMVAAGYTEVAEFHYLHHIHKDEEVPGIAMAAALIRAAKIAGIRLTLVPVLYERSGFGEDGPKDTQQRFALSAGEYLELLDALRAHEGPQMRLGIGFHSLRAVKESSYAEVLEGAHKLGFQGPVHIHIAEQTGEVEQCLEQHRQRPVEWLYNNVDVDERWCLVHATHLSDKEADLIARSGTVAGLCPTTEANLGDGVFDLARFEALGGRYGIGSDSHITVSPLDELRWLEYSNRLSTRSRLVAGRSASVPCGRTLYEQAISGGRAVTGGGAWLTPGAPADLCLYREDSPFLAGRGPDELLETLIFAAPETGPAEVLIAGKTIAEKGQATQKTALDARFREALAELVDP